MNTNLLDETRRQATCWCGASAGMRAAFWGSILILMGGLGLLSAFVPLQSLGHYVLPVFLVLWGGFILISRFARRS